MLKERKCIYCGKVFKTDSLRKKQCDNCKSKTGVKTKSKPTPKVKPLSIAEAVSVIEKYNRENHTCFTYGNFPHKELLCR